MGATQTNRPHETDHEGDQERGCILTASRGVETTTLSDQTLPSPSIGPPLLSASISPPLSWAIPLMKAGAVATGGAVVGGGGGGGGIGGGGPPVGGAATTGGAVGGGRGGTVVGGVGAGRVVLSGGGMVVLVVVWGAGVGLTAVAWEFDVRPRPRARPPATRAAITAVRIASRLVTLTSFELVCVAV